MRHGTAAYTAAFLGASWVASVLLIFPVVSVVVKCVVKDQQVGPFFQASFKSLSFFFSVRSNE